MSGRGVNLYSVMYWNSQTNIDVNGSMIWRFLWHVSELTVSKYTSVPHVEGLRVWISHVGFIMLRVPRAFLSFPVIVCVCSTGLMVMFCQMRNDLIFHLFCSTSDNVFRSELLFVFLNKCYSATACCACKWMARYRHWRMFSKASDYINGWVYPLTTSKFSCFWRLF